MKSRKVIVIIDNACIRQTFLLSFFLLIGKDEEIVVLVDAFGTKKQQHQVLKHL